MSRFQRIGMLSLNLFDLCVTPASSLKTSSRSDVGHLLMTSLSNKYLDLDRSYQLQIVSSILSQDMGKLVC
ncbi:hypothetical protein EDB89DRAFT_2013914 [Lactarius sanguifluus]|nr:hypothetical protein EDB89DRAFT_2013914 [Lactarius sanguifluus]